MDPKVPVNKGKKSKAYNPIKDMTQRMHKIGANTDRTAIQNDEPTTVAGKIFNGLAETARKAPKGIAQGVSKGMEGAGEALGKTKDTFLYDKRMHAGLKQAGKFALFGASIPAVMVGGTYLASQAPSLLAAGASGLGRMAGAARDTLLSHPELFIEGQDLVEGILDPGPPPPSKGGYIGGLASKIYDKFNK